MNGHAYVSALVQRQDDALLQVEPVVSADGYTQQPQTAYRKHTAEQGQSLPPAHAHATQPSAGGAHHTQRWSEGNAHAMLSIYKELLADCKSGGRQLPSLANLTYNESWHALKTSWKSHPYGNKCLRKHKDEAWMPTTQLTMWDRQAALSVKIHTRREEIVHLFRDKNTHVHSNAFSHLYMSHLSTAGAAEHVICVRHW